MSTFSSKVCIVGDFAVGKTSTIERFVNNQFSEKYLTTIGVKIDTKEVLADDIDLKLIIWDIAGSDRFGEIEFSYLRGASGYIFVADGTRSKTLSAAEDLRKQAEERYGELPFVFLVNKSDLGRDWEIKDEHLDLLRQSCGDVFITSAKTGENVEDALTRLGSLIAARELYTAG